MSSPQIVRFHYTKCFFFYMIGSRKDRISKVGIRQPVGGSNRREKLTNVFDMVWVCAQKIEDNFNASENITRN